MALVIYPTEDYDSFITLVDAVTVAETLTVNASAWTGLTDAEQEIYLRIALRRIEDGVDQDEDPYPDPMPTCVGEAQALMAIQDVVYGISANTQAETGSVKKHKVSSLEIEYYDSTLGATRMVSVIPEMARPCLEELGYDVPPTILGLSQSTLGRS